MENTHRHIGSVIVALACVSMQAPAGSLSPLDDKLADWSQSIHDDWGRAYRVHEMLIAHYSNEAQWPEEQILDKQLMYWDSDKTPLDVQLRRSRALFGKLKTLSGMPDISALEAELAGIERETKALADAEDSSGSVQDLYYRLRGITRKAALKNPLLDFNDILFVTWHSSGPHMCNQYMGRMTENASQLGIDDRSGLFILRDFKSDRPGLSSILEGKRVPGGTNKGALLTDGVSLSPDLSWDGKTIVFSWASGVTTQYPRDYKCPTHLVTPERIASWLKREERMNIFRINLDGTDLRRLTDVGEDDVDPCWLPSGRLAFMSTRRGGYLRCAPGAGPRTIYPTFVLFSMKPDGSDIYPLSFHETNEWHPSVNNDGMIVYTRWDYVDRSDMIAHHLWTCFPDGRDPRAPHGNYPLPHQPKGDGPWTNGLTLRPMCEFNIRAIPGSHKYMATACRHHGQSFGSLIMIDTALPDDGVMSQVKRVTPEYSLPEADPVRIRSLKASHATPWPLNEDFYLLSSAGNLYLRDRYGNEVALFLNGNKSFRAIDPIPIKARTVPPVIPTQTFQGERGKGEIPRSTVYVQNVYTTDALGILPKDVRIEEMRIVQIFPKTTPARGAPRISTYPESLARMALGTVPVEEDGSVYCEAPAGKAIYFQLLDDRGVAVQSMRSATYLHAGERSSCVGCHEDKQNAPPKNANSMALRRGPSKLKPEADPSVIWPFTYARSVRPVFESKCLPCHQEKKAQPTDFSYRKMGKFMFGFSGYKKAHYIAAKTGGTRTTPGDFGSGSSELTQYLFPKHYGVKLTKGEFRRITMWLDMNSNELGAYHHEEEQRAGKRVWPLLDVDPENPQGIATVVDPPRKES